MTKRASAEGPLIQQQNRLSRLLLPHVEEADAILSDAELVYRVKQRFDLAWNRAQVLIDPNE